MKKALQANGNSWQLYINKPLADIIGITKVNYIVTLVIQDKTIGIQLYDNATETTGLLVKKLIKRGSGYGLNISKPLLEILEINPEVDILDIDISNNRLIIKKDNHLS